MSSFTNYLKDTRGEMKHVNWPTRSTAIAFTIIVIVVSVLTAFYLGLFDFIFTSALKGIIYR
ncbi:MAG: preprotein translocase subunit SecE [Candidatus Paceibacterota bacterium]|jgi:preprotein translocase SecE subunit